MEQDKYKRGFRNLGQKRRDTTRDPPSRDVYPERTKGTTDGHPEWLPSVTTHLSLQPHKEGRGRDETTTKHRHRRREVLSLRTDLRRRHQDRERPDGDEDTDIPTTIRDPWSDREPPRQ